MPLVLSGTNGVSGVDGTASNPSYEGTDSNTGIFFPAADTIAFAEGGTEIARFDSSGNLGIGTTSPTETLTTVTSSAQIARFKSTSSANNNALVLETSGSASSINIWMTNSSANTSVLIRESAGALTFSTGGTNSGGRDSNTERARITSGGDFQFNSGYGSVATAYGCRAWVNFDGTASGTFAGGVSTVTRIAGSTTATVTTTTAHGLITGNVVQALTGVVAGTYTVTFISATQFSFTTVATTALTAASITFAVNSIRASGNVSSVADNGTGTYTVNLTNAMPDANYSVVLGMNSAIDASFIKLGKSAGIGVPTTSAFQVNTTNFSAVYTDYPGVFVAVFR
jgi:hypothetical protein